MTNDDSSPATKKDIKEINVRLDSHDEQFIKVLDFIKAESDDTRKYIDMKHEETMIYIDKKHEETMIYIDKKHEETMRYFDVVAEDIRHDFGSANREEIDVLKDRTNNHEKRIKRLELRPV